MALKTDAAGRTWDPVSFSVEADRIAAYADAVGESSPVHRDSDAAREAGYRDVVAPPMFCVVYSSPAMGPALFDQDGARTVKATWTNIVSTRSSQRRSGSMEALRRLPQSTFDVVSARVTEADGDRFTTETEASQGDNRIIRNASATVRDA
ncbi:hypothetical protein BH24ACT23_BH24ACT23_05860 [soil metagenome]